MGRREIGTTYTRGGAFAAGMTRAQLRDDGVRVSRGAYVSRAVPLSMRNAAVAALGVLPQHAVLSHRTAAVLLGAPVPVSWPLEFTVRPGDYRPRRRHIRVYVRNLEPADVIRHRGLPLSSGAQTFLDLAASLPEDELVAVGDALFRAAHLDPATVAGRLRRADGVRGVLRARACAPLLSPLAMSRPESLFRYWLIDSELPDPEPQIPVFDRRGRVVAHADLGYRRWKIAIEYEGRQHAEQRQFSRDLTRYSLMAADGWLTLRFGAADLGRRSTVIDRVAGALRSRGASW
jgi:hypothetical protein